MGYVHDTGMSQIIPFSTMTFVTGAWTEVAAVNQWSKNKAPAAETSIIRVPVTAPQNGSPYKGSLVKSIDIWWSNGTADLTSLTPVIQKLTAPLYDVAPAAPTSLAFTYDSDHDTAAKRVTQKNHKMTLTLSSPVWLDDDDILFIELTVVAPATAAYKQKDARVNYTLRA
ncbi:MAG: hypothetical protein M1281_17055 [Chloroflexi bacterium]|nr:hypothetical protein [Chloroflexota bacterium]